MSSADVHYPGKRSGVPVTYQFADGVGTIRLADPTRRNAMDQPWVASFQDATARCAAQDGLRAVLIIADGPAFTVGGDLELFAETDATELPELISRMTQGFHSALLRLANLNAPVVCAVQGGVGGGGLGLTYVADIVLVAEGARFGLGFCALGLSGDGGASWFLPRLVGTRRAAELYLENRVLSADEAVEWGLATRVVAPKDLEQHAGDLAARLAAGPTRAFGGVRQLLYRAWGDGLAEQLDAEVFAIRASSSTQDAVEGIRAFRDKRTPTFEGR